MKDLALELFCQFDRENQGYITQAQLLNGSCKDGLFAEFSEGQILSIFEVLDKENKGVITLSDFTDAFVTDGNGSYPEDEFYQQENYSDHNSLSVFSSMLDGEEIYVRSPSPHVYGSTESLPNYNDQVSNLQRSASCQSEEDWNWDHQTQPSMGMDLTTGRKRTDSLPSIMDPLILRKAKRNLLKSKKWVSVDQGMDNSFLTTNGFPQQFETNNNLKNQRLNGLTKSDSRIDKILIPLKKLSKHLSHSKNELRMNHEKRSRKKRHGRSFFGSKESVLSNIRCNSCASMRSRDKYYSSNEDLSHCHNSLASRMSHNNLSRIPKPFYLKHSSSEHICSDVDYSDNESGYGKYNRYISRDSLLSNQNGFYISCENVSTPIVDVSIENWESFLRRISGVSLFAG